MKKRIILLTTALLALVLLIIAGYFGLFGKNKGKTVYDRVKNTLGDQAYATTLTDTDNDGLKDWEEALWKTDPKKADTDGDGYTDGDEARQGYDPLDPLSNPQTGKKTEKNPLAESAYSKQELENLNLTQNLASSMTSYVKNPSTLASTSPDNPFTMLDEKTGMGLLNLVDELRPQIAESEIKTTGDNSIESVKKYVSEISQAIPTNPNPSKSESEVFYDAMRTGDYAEIDRYINYYNTAIANMKKIVVPTDFLQLHKREIELFMATKKVCESVKESDSDPLKTILALQEYEKIGQEAAGLSEQFLKLVQAHAQ